MTEICQAQNIVTIPTPESWWNTTTGGPGPGLPGILDEPDGEYILDESGARILEDP